MTKKRKPMDDLPTMVSVEDVAVVETSTPMRQKVIDIHTTTIEFALQKIETYAKLKIQGKLKERQAKALNGYLEQLIDSDAYLEDGRRVRTEFDAIRYWLEQLSKALVS